LTPQHSKKNQGKSDCFWGALLGEEGYLKSAVLDLFVKDVPRSSAQSKTKEESGAAAVTRFKSGGLAPCGWDSLFGGGRYTTCQKKKKQNKNLGKDGSFSASGGGNFCRTHKPKVTLNQGPDDLKIEKGTISMSSSRRKKKKKEKNQKSGAQTM